MRPRHKASIRGQFAWIMSLLLMTSLLIGAPAMPAAADPGSNPGVQAPKDSGRPPAIPDSDRIPVESANALPPDSIELTETPAFVAPPNKSPKEIVAELDPAPMASGANFDAFSLEDGSTHVALVYPEDVNTQLPDGSWVKDQPGLAVEPGGWSAVIGHGSLHLPSTLSATTPVRLDQAGLSVAMLPSVVVPSAPAQVSGNTVSYPSAVSGATLRYGLDPLGFSQDTVIADKKLIPPLSWNMAGATLRSETNGTVSVLSGTTVVATIQAPRVTDSGGNPQPLTATYSVSGSTLSIAPDLSKAKFPVTVRTPFVVGDEADGDTYVDQALPTTSFETSPDLKVGPKQNSYLKFDLADVVGDEGTVTQAILGVQASAGSGRLGVKEVATTWPSAGTFTWSTQPQVGSQEVASDVGGPDATFEFDLTTHYEGLVDAGTEDMGLQLTSTTSMSLAPTTSPTNASLLVVMNAISNDPVLKYPDPNETLENPSPTLRIEKVPSDPDGDDVQVRYLVVNQGANFKKGNYKYNSDWTDTKSATIPSGTLVDGQRYDWKVQSWDGHKLKKGHDYPASDIHDFQFSPRLLGEDERYGMWAQALGNDMTAKVNEANGNLYLSVPLDKLVTPTDAIQLGLTYNSQATDGTGLGRGWDVYAGPGSSYRELPIWLKEVGQDAEGGVKIKYQDGSIRYFGKSDKNRFQGAGLVTENNNGSYTLVTSSGGIFTFQPGGQIRDLDRARAAFASPKATDGTGTTFEYAFDNDHQIKSMTDPLNRVIHFTWKNNNDPTLTIKAWDDRTFTIDKTDLAAGKTRLEVTDPLGATRTFTMSTLDTDGAGFLTAIQDGVQSAADLGHNLNNAWKIDYQRYPIADHAQKVDYRRVWKVNPPPATVASPVTPDMEQALGNGYHEFIYEDVDNKDNYHGTIAPTTLVFDPRHVSGTDMFETIVSFNTAGLPVAIEGPQDNQGTKPWPKKTFVFDKENQLVCERSAEANAAKPVVKAENCVKDAYSKIFEYDGKTGKLKREVGPKPVAPGVASSQANDRLETTYHYDEGFQGVWATYYNNVNLAGLPAGEELFSQDMDKAWGNKPPGVDNNDRWSVRLTGYLDIPSWDPNNPDHARDYEFKLFSKDGGSLSIGSAGLVDCFGDPRTPQQADYANCGENHDADPVRKILAPGDRHAFSLQFANLPDDGGAGGKFTLKWDHGSDGADFDVLEQVRFHPARGLLTSKTIGTATDTSTTPDRPATVASTTTYTYPQGPDHDSLMERGLAETEILHDSIGGSPDRTTTYSYDDYGRLRSKTLPSGGGPARSTTYNYPASGANRACMTSEVGPGGIETIHECNPAGDVITTDQVVRAVGDQGLQHRTTHSCVDALGRATVVDSPGPGAIVNVYDKAGRLLTTKQLVSGPATAFNQASTCANPTSIFGAGSVVAETSNTYNDRGQLIRKDLPSPDGIAARPFEIYRYDASGNQVERVDANGKVWKTAYDAQGRTIGTQSPLGRETTTTYVLRDAAGVFKNQVVSTDAALVSNVTTSDVLGRTIKTQTGKLAAGSLNVLQAGSPLASEVLYDERGNAVSNITHAPSKDIVSTSVYNGFNEATLTSQPFLPDGVPASPVPQAQTKLEYDGAGRLDLVTGPNAAGIPGARKISFDYDGADRITNVSLPGLGTPNGTSVVYDDAGERIEVATIMSASQTQVRSWTYELTGSVDTATVHGARVDGGPQQETSSSFDYNAAGWLTSNELPDGYALSYSYDRLGQETRASYEFTGEAAFARHSPGCRGCSGNSATIVSTYDKAGNLDTTSRGSYFFDIAMNFDNQVTKVDGGQLGGVTDYEYFADSGQLHKMTTSAGITEYAYNDNGQIASVKDPFTGSISGYFYDCAGRLIGRGGAAPAGCVGAPPTTKDAGNLTWARTFEAGTGRIATQTISANGTQAAFFKQTYDSVGNVMTRTERVADPTSAGQTTPGAGAWSYVYDDASRLKTATQTPQDMAGTATGPSKVTNYTYDGAGNRTSVKVGSGPLRTMTYDDAGLPIAEHPDNSTPDTTYTFDATGHLSGVDSPDADKSRCYAYDGFGNLSGANLGSTSGCAVGSGALTMDYDPFNRMAAKSSMGQNPSESTFQYQGTSEDLSAETDSVGGSTLFVSSPGGPLAQKDASGTSFFMKDLHGDVVGMTSGGTQNFAQLFSPYGEPEESRSVGGVETRLGFQGDFTDPDTGLVDMGARLYDPMLARFTSRDTVFGDLKNPSSMNQFGYANGNPLTMADPSGLAATWAQYYQQLAVYEAAWTKYYADLDAYNEAYAEYKDQLQEYNAALALYHERFDAWQSRTGGNFHTDPGLRRSAPTFNKTRPTFDMQEPSMPALTKPTTPTNGQFIEDEWEKQQRSDFDAEDAGWDVGVWWLSHHSGAENSYKCGDLRFGDPFGCHDNADIVPPGAGAITLGDQVYCRDVCDHVTITHESVHVMMVRKYGTGDFAAMYTGEASVNGSGRPTQDDSNVWSGNRYEIPAYAEDQWEEELCNGGYKDCTTGPVFTGGL